MKAKLNQGLINIRRKAGVLRSRKGLQKKKGNEALIIALVLIVIGVALSFIYKDQVSTMIGNFITNISTKLTNLLK